jgi:pimeloyl-ACP methyl ester carboxylesterase
LSPAAPRTSRLAVGLLLAAVLTLAGCTLPVVAPNGGSNPGPVSPAPAAPGGTAVWRPCPEVPKQVVGRGATGMTYDCASVSVPQDWTAPSTGDTYDVQLLRVRSSTQHDRIGSLLINPGGPGASGIDTVVYQSFGQQLGGLPKAITDRFDLIGFDPRGVGRSDPIRCISSAEQDQSFGSDPDPVAQSEFDTLVTLNSKIDQDCAAKYQAQLSTFSTKQAARDMDAIRAAVGDPKLTYLGFSYGTSLGAAYAQLFPQNIRAMVLDGAVDPQQNLVDATEIQAKGFELAFSNFATWCKATPDQCAIGPDARAAVTDALAKAEASPLTAQDGRKVTAGWVLYSVIASLYTETAWPQLADAIDALRAGDPRGVMALADSYVERNRNGVYSNLFEALLVYNCTDSASTISTGQIRTLQTQWRKKYPLFGASAALGLLGCAEWTGKRDPLSTGKAAGAPPIVVVGTTGDPATPYQNTAALASMLGVGQVLTWEGEGHTAYPHTTCITTAVDEYLINRTVPPAGQRCPAR